MLPPPAPISIMSIDGMVSGMPLPSLKRYCGRPRTAPVTSGLRSSIRQALAVVPPMSKRHQPVEAEALGVIGGGERAGGRAALDHPHRIAAGDLRADHAAGADSMISGRLANAGLCQAARQAAQIGLGDRHGVGVDGGGRGARIFADLRRDGRRQRTDRGPAQRPRSASATALLVGRIAEALIRQIATETHAAAAQAGASASTSAASTPRSTAPSARMRSSTLEGQLARDQRRRRTRSAGRTSRSGARCGSAARRGSPSVVISAVGGPLRSISALVTTVVAWTTTPSNRAGATPALASITFTPRKKPSSRSWWVVRVLSTVSAPVARRAARRR